MAARKKKYARTLYATKTKLSEMANENRTLYKKELPEMATENRTIY